MSTRLRVFLSLSLFLLLALIVATPSFAQTSRGTVSGTVSDPQGAAIVGAAVELHHKDKNQTRAVTTNDAGLYRFDAVDLGIYDLTVKASGFKAYVKREFQVVANRITSLDAPLELGEQQSVIEVSASVGEILQKSDPVRGGNFDRKEIVYLPLTNADPWSLARTLPGVTVPSGITNNGAPSNLTNGGAAAQFAINGQRTRANNFLLDGTDSNDISITGPAATFRDPDAYAEFSVQTGLFSAEFGRAGGGVLNLITKSGTNQFHGTGRWLFRSNAFNALTNEERVAGLTKPAVFTNNIFGGTVGGPIRKDKTFFFASVVYDRFRATNNSPAFVIPTAAGKARLQQLFPNRSNPRVDLYLAAWEGLDGLTNPTPVALGLDPVTGVDRGSIEFGRAGITFANPDDTDQYIFRIDHRLNDNQMLAFRYAFDDTVTSPTPSGLNGPGFTADAVGRKQNFLMTHTWVLSPTLTNEFRFSYARPRSWFPFTASNKELANTLQRVDIRGLSLFGMQPEFPQGRVANNWLYQETMSKVKGTHTFRFGAEILRQLAKQSAPFNARGSFVFQASGGYTSLANYIDNYSGRSGIATIDFGSPIYFPNLFRQTYFFQDNWKVSPSLTLTMGLRYENFGQPANGAFGFPAFAGFDPAQFLAPNKVKRDDNNFGPVFGFAWSPSYQSGVLGRLFGDGKTVWRGGFQVSYDTGFNNLLSNVASDTPNVISTNVTDASAATSRGTPNFYPNAIPQSARTPTPGDAQTSVLLPGLVSPYTERWSFGFQRELPQNLVMDLSYVGSVAHKLFTNEELNPFLPSGPRLYPNFGRRQIRGNSGNSNYHALQARLDRRFSKGVQLTGSYTWSKFIDATSEVFTRDGTSSILSIPLYQGGLQLDRAVSLFDRTHRLVVSYIWELPGPKSGVLGNAFGGWQMSGITTLQSGNPFTITQGADRNLDGTASDRPDVGNPNAPHNTRAIISATSPTGYTNPDTNQPVTRNDVYVVQGVGHPGPGTIGKNTERSKRTNNFDWTLFKNFRIREGLKLEYRLETFNLFNHQQFFEVPAATVVTALRGAFLNHTLVDGTGREIKMGLKLIW
ncbi:MAG: carboxypeptidase regulatory-like domain-containing protein [Acidobacteria bacterium]|nr:carboxypeptidase regulatory-like domain-containing protein [Acidobacteriota bacterium]